MASVAGEAKKARLLETHAEDPEEFVQAILVMAYIGMADIVMAYIVMA